MSHAWIVKYAPKSAKEVVGRDEELKVVQDYLAKDLKKDAKNAKPLLIAGPPGAGKTSLIYAAAKDFEIIEVNASDSRNKAAIEEIIGGALNQQSLFMKPRLVLIDEVDGVSGMKDRGGVSALATLLAKTNTHAIMTANDGDSDKLKPIRKLATTLFLAPLSQVAVVSKLSEIATKESLNLSSDIISAIARRSGGDLRAAINDLQTIAQTGDVSFLSDRDHTSSIEDALLRVFKTTNPTVALNAFDDVPATPDEIIMWVDHNLAKEYTKPEDIVKAYDMVSRADVFLSRIRRQQHYRFYVYIYAYLSAGIALSKEEKYKSNRSYTRSDRPLKMWIAKNSQLKKQAIAEKIAKKTHTSVSQVLQEFPFWMRMFQQKTMLTQFSDAFDLDSEQLAWIKQKA